MKVCECEGHSRLLLRTYPHTPILTHLPMNIRPATEQDQDTIKRIVRAARINPFDLKWQKFLIAEDADAIIGVRQIKTHDDGSRELASIAVIPEKQAQGIGAAIVRALMQAQAPPLYLMCREEMESFYARFGFRRIEVDVMSKYFRRMFRLVNAMPEFLRENVRVIVMKWEGEK